MSRWSRGLSRIVAKFTEQPGSGKLPSSVNRAWSDLKQFGDLINAQSCKEPQPNNSTDFRLLLFQATDGFVERQNFIGIFQSCHIRKVNRLASPLSPSFQATLGLCMINQNLPHGFGRRREKMCFPGPGRTARSDQFQKCFVDQGSWLQGMIRSLQLHSLGGDSSKLAVNQWK